MPHQIEIYTRTYTCGHTETEKVEHWGEAKYGDQASTSLCPECGKKQDAAIGRLCRKLTGETPDGGKLRWRLRATAEAVQQAFAARGLPLPELIRDCGDNAAQERRLHASTLKMMRCGRVRCACGDCGTWERTISGTIGLHAAMWAACARCSGTAIGGGLTGDDLHRAIAAIDSANRCGESIDAWVDAA